MNTKILILILLFFNTAACADKIELKLIDNSVCVTDTDGSIWIDDLYLYKIDSLKNTVCRNRISRIHNLNKYSDTICFFTDNDGYKADANHCIIERGFKYKIVGSNPGFEDFIFFTIDQNDNIVFIEK